MSALKNGSRGDEVKALQAKLNQLGFTLEVDGIFGDNTQNAVITLQTIFGYTVDGIVGPGTMQLIDAQNGYHWNLVAARKAFLPAQGTT